MKKDLMCCVKNKKTLITIGTAVIGAVILILVGALLLTKFNSTTPTETEVPVAKSDIEMADEYFEGCNLLSENCLSSSCDFYLFCNDQKYEMCRVYDCDDSHGVATKVANKKLSFKRQIKPQVEKILEMVNACSGETAILSNKCVNGKTEIELSVKTTGNCLVSNFIAKNKEGKGIGGVKFEQTATEKFLVTVPTCEKLGGIVVVGVNGITIDTKALP